MQDAPAGSPVSQRTLDMLVEAGVPAVSQTLFGLGIMNAFVPGLAPANPANCRFAGPACTLRAIPIREDVRARTGIAVSIGMAPTQLLCKLANELAKGDRGAGGVRVMPSDPAARQSLLRAVPVGDLWGVGPGMGARLRAHGIVTAADLAEAEPGRLRSFLGVVGERLGLEARGVACHVLREEQGPRKSILSSRSFGRPVTDRAELAESLAYHAAHAAQKLREDGLVAATLVAFARTNKHRPDLPQRRLDVAVRVDPPTDDAARLASAAAAAVDGLWEPGFEWKKAGVCLHDLSPASRSQPSLPGLGPGESEARRRLMAAMDKVNAQLGRDALRLASTGIERVWKGKSGRRTDLSTTDPERLPVAKAGDPRVKRTRIRFHE